MTDKDILELFIEIGFTLHKEGNTGIGETQELKYYPDYLYDKHYTLVTFKHNNYNGKPTGTDFRLYIHNNIDGSYFRSPFQTSNLESVILNVNKIFKSELRDIKLNNILYESSM